MWFLKLFLFGGHHCTLGNSKTKWHQYWRLISYLLVLFLALDFLEAAEMCPEFGRIRGFRHEGLEHGRFLGRWFEQWSHASFSDMTGKCYSKYYSRKKLGDPYELQTTEDYVSSLTGFTQTSEDEILIEDYNDPSLFKSKGSSLFFGQNRYRIIATDYDSYAIEYSCSDSALLSRSESIWILTRKKRPARRIMRKALRALRELGLSNSKLVKIDQSCNNELSFPTTQTKSQIRRRQDFDSDIEDGEDYYYYEDGDTTSTDEDARPKQPLNWKSSTDLAKDLMGTVTYVGQAVFAPWTLPGSIFSVHGPNKKKKERQ